MQYHKLLFALALLGFSLVAVAPSSAAAQQGQPLNLPCVTGVSVLPLGQAMPDDASGQALVMARLEIAPHGGFQAHTHPGTLVVTIESGTFELTQLGDMEMSVNRAAANGTPAASEPMEKGASLTLNPGDWFAEPKGMVHEASNPGTEPTVVLLTGLVDPNQPLVQCVGGTPAS
ncbi:MAG TPA: cupin domain-containing protein [Thermomicrobiales bacterium]|nr:cupin domain-containing protein [Thermomicrobiales bacterium]